MEEETREEEIFLPVGGLVPGIGGGWCGPGWYLVNWAERSIKQIEVTVDSIAATMASADTPTEAKTTGALPPVEEVSAPE